MYEHSDKVIINFASHVLRAGFKNQVSSEENYVDLTTFQTPSISPILGNNPSYTIAKFENNKIYSISSFSFLLTEYTMVGAQKWRRFDWQIDFGVDLNDANSVRTFYQKMMRDSALFN